MSCNRRKAKRFCERLVLLGVLFAGSAMATRAQQLPVTVPQFDLAGGYSYVRANSAQAFNLHGGNASIAYNLPDRYSFVGEFGVYRFSGLPAGVRSNMYTYLAGPRVSWRNTSRYTPYSQILLGVGRLDASSKGVDAGENAFAASVGGGLNVELNSRLAIRAIQADYLLTRFARLTGASATQNDLRLSAGIVIHLGRR